MNQRKLGRTNLLVSALGLNTAGFGSVHDQTAAFALLDCYHASGGSFLQAAGTATSSGENRSEEIVGRWLEARNIARDRLVLASRISFARPAHGGSIAFINSIRAATERSLRRLRIRHLNLLVCAWDDQLVPLDDLLEATDQLIRTGWVRQAVAGSFPSWRVADSLHRAQRRGRARFEAVQARYSLMDGAGPGSEAIAMSREHRLGFFADSPLAGGFLARRPVSLRELLNLDRNWREPRFGGPAGDSILRTLAEIADRRSATPAQVALAWVLQNPQVTAAIIRPSTVRELTELIHAPTIILSAAETTALAKVATALFVPAEPAPV